MANARSMVNRSLQQLLSKRPTPLAAMRTFDQFEAQLPKMADHRAMVLVMTAILENLLEEVILTRFIKPFSKELRGKMFGGGAEGAAIAGFYGKIILGRALGIYGQAFQDDLDRIRRIRNVFAHAARPLNFNSRQLADACTFNIFDSRISRHTPRFGKTAPYRFLGAAGLMSIVLLTLARNNRRFRPRQKPNRTWVYADPAPPLATPAKPSGRQRSGTRPPLAKRPRRQ